MLPGLGRFPAGPAAMLATARRVAAGLKWSSRACAWCSRRTASSDAKLRAFDFPAAIHTPLSVLTATMQAVHCLQPCTPLSRWKAQERNGLLLQCCSMTATAPRNGPLLQCCTMTANTVMQLHAHDHCFLLCELACARVCVCICMHAPPLQMGPTTSTTGLLLGMSRAAW